MAEYIFVYHGGGRPESEADQAKAMEAWGAFYEKLGPNLANGGAPVGMSSTVTKGGVSGDGGANPISGFTVVNADSMDAATEMAKGCPLVQDGSGSVEVAECIAM